jgi:hypothetical protein
MPQELKKPLVWNVTNQTIRAFSVNDELLITHVFVCIDDIIRQLPLDSQPGPVGKLSLSELLTIIVLHPLLKSGFSLKRYYYWFSENWKRLFPGLVHYTRFTRIMQTAQEFLVIVQQRLADLNCFGLVADGTSLPVMHVKRGPYAKSFREGRKVYCASKNEWSWGFLLEFVLDQGGKIAWFSVSTEAEIRQLVTILEDLKDRWVMADKGNRGKEIHKKLWNEKQIRIKITQSKERTWIENVIGTLKENLGLARIKVRKKPSLMARIKAIFCAYNIAVTLNLPI